MAGPLARSDLDVLAETIREARGEAEASALDFYAAILRAGQAAIEAKAALPHGRFTPWLEASCEVTPREARNWMRLAKSGLTPEEIAANGGVRALVQAARPKTETVSVLPNGDKPHPLDAPRKPRRGVRVKLAEAEAEIDSREVENDFLRERIAELEAGARDREAKGSPELAARVATLERENAALRRKVEALQRELGKDTRARHAEASRERGAARAVVNTSSDLRKVGTTTRHESEARTQSAAGGAHAQGELHGFRGTIAPQNAGH